MLTSHVTTSHIHIEGEFLGFSRNSEAERKYLRVSVADGEIQLKIAKELRHILTEEWMQGDRIQIFAKTKFKGKSDQPQFKAYHVDRLSCTLQFTKNSEKSAEEKSPQRDRGKILICQKSGCLKGSGKNLYSEIERALSQLGLQDRVKIETTGCQKRCKQAPNMILMPENRRCSQINTNSIYLLLKKHYDR
jgi:hypothetical protein